jgi:ankyrin repeat protein
MLVVCICRRFKNREHSPMVKKEKAFHLPPRSLFDLVATNDLAQLSISVRGINPHDTSPGSLVLSSKQRPLTSDGLSTVGTAARGLVGSITASMVAFERDVGGFTALHVAAAHGHLEMVKVLVEEYHSSIAALSDSGKSPLFVAVEQGHELVVRYLLDQGGDNLQLVTADEQKTLFTVSLQKQHHTITVLLDAALDQTGYDPRTIDPVDAALKGDLFYFALEKARLEADLAAKRNGGSDPFSRIVFAMDSSKNPIVASIAAQQDITDAQIAVAKFLLANHLAGDLNIGNSVRNSALHNLAISTGEKVLDVDILTRRIAFMRLLLEHGADVRRANGSGSTPAQCTENPVMKLSLAAAEKGAVFQESYVRRNQVPLADRAVFGAACKDLKRAFRAAEELAAKALLDPTSVVIPGGAPAAASSSAQPSPKTSARGPAKTNVTLQILEAKNLPSRQVEATDGSSLDVFVTVIHGGAVVYQSSVVSSSSNPTWESASVSLQVTDGEAIEIRVEDKELPTAPAPAPIGSATLTIDSAVTAGGERELPLQGVDGAVVRVKVVPV